MEFLDDEALAILKARRRRRQAGHAARALRPRAGAGEHRQGAGGVHAPRPQPRAQPHHRRQPHRISAVASAPNVSDLDRGRRPGNYADYCDLLRLVQSLNIIQFVGRLSGRAGRPAAADAPSRRALCRRSPSPTLWHPYSLGKQRISDAIEMICIARGITREAADSASPACSRSSTPTRRSASTGR